MTYINNKSRILFSTEVASLANGAAIDTGFQDGESYNGYQVSITADQPTGMTLVQEVKIDAAGTSKTIEFPITSALSSSLDNTFSATFRERYLRYQFRNDSGAAITNVKIEFKALGGGIAQPSVFTLNANPVAQSQATLTQAVNIGQDQGGVFRKVGVNEVGASLISDFGTEVARGGFDTYNITTKFGRNTSIDTGSVPEDIWNGGGLYTGFDCVTSQRLRLVSSDVNDTGSLITSGTATGGSNNVLIDSTATFVTDGVVAGDLVIDDTKTAHGIVLTVDSETQITIFDLRNSDTDIYSFESGDVYRIARATSTGAAVIKLTKMLDSDYISYSEYVILNGTTEVFTTGSYIRQSRGQIVLAGSSNTNEGEVTARQETTTANVTMVMPAESGQTAICCDTVPRGKIWVIKRLFISMGRANGSAGSANARFQVRAKGGAWKTKRFPIITDGLDYSVSIEGGIIAREGDDVRWNIQSVSDNSTTVSAEFEYYEINR
jgi:hypothetical protein